MTNAAAFAHLLLVGMLISAALPVDQDVADDQDWPTGATDDVPLSIDATALGARTESIPAGFDINYSYEMRHGVIGVDGRQQMTASSVDPRTVKIYFITADGAASACSGALISAHHVLTNAHCVRNQNSWQVHRHWLVVPGLINGWHHNDAHNSPVSMAEYGHSEVTRYRESPEWLSGGGQAYDIAVLTLARPLGDNAGYFPFDGPSASDARYSSALLETRGYPGDLDDGRTQIRSLAEGCGASGTRHTHNLDTAGGQSGSPIYDYWDRKVISVVSHTPFTEDPTHGLPCSNKAVRITPTWKTTFDGWIASDAVPPSRADLEERVGRFGTLQNPHHQYVVVEEMLQADSTFDARMDIWNSGTAPSGAFDVSFWASRDVIISPTDYPLGSYEVGSIDPQDFRRVFVSRDLNNQIPDGPYYFGWRIDPNSEVNEYDESNNVGYLPDRFLVDGTPPTATLAVSNPYLPRPGQGIGYRIDVDWTAADAGSGLDLINIDRHFRAVTGEYSSSNLCRTWTADSYREGRCTDSVIQPGEYCYELLVTDQVGKWVYHETCRDVVL